MTKVAHLPEQKGSIENTERVLKERIDRVTVKMETVPKEAMEWYHAYRTGLEEALWVIRQRY